MKLPAAVGVTLDQVLQFLEVHPADIVQDRDGPALLGDVHRNVQGVMETIGALLCEVGRPGAREALDLEAVVQRASAAMTAFTAAPATPRRPQARRGDRPPAGALPASTRPTATSTTGAVSAMSINA